MPVIAIVGRPNVGKSSLLNALTGKRISIVQDMPGVTRDRVSIPLQVDGKWVELVDTGGYGFDDSQGLTDHIRHQIEIAMARADLVLFVVDITAGITAGDQTVAQLLRTLNRKVVILANKADGEKVEPAGMEFSRLGFGSPLPVSALNRRNMENVFVAIRNETDLSNAPTDLPTPQMYLAIVGKRNAGKSTLVNAIAKLYDENPNPATDDERVIVSEVPGTTRDSVDVRFEKDGKALVVIDTAGVRKKRHMVTDDIEFYSFHRAQRSVRRADVVLHLIDATEVVSEPDKKLAQYIVEQFKPVIFVVNKWDIARESARQQASSKPFRDEDLMEQYVEYLHKVLPHLSFAPVAFVTAKEGKNIHALLDASSKLFKQANLRVTTGRLNAAVKQALTERAPSTKRGERPKVFYATQVGVAPPTLVLKVNREEFFSETYQRYLINRFRELLPYTEVPIRLHIRGKESRVEHMQSLVERREEELLNADPLPPDAVKAKARANSRRAVKRS